MPRQFSLSLSGGTLQDAVNAKPFFSARARGELHRVPMRHDDRGRIFRKTYTDDSAVNHDFTVFNALHFFQQLADDVINLEAALLLPIKKNSDPTQSEERRSPYPRQEHR